MKSQKLTWAIEILLWIGLAAPLIHSFRSVFPFIVPTAFLFQLAIAGATLCYLVLLIQDRSFRPKFNTLAIGIALFFLLNFVLVLFSQNPHLSFWGLPERMDGFWSFFHYFLFFFVASSVLKTREQVQRLIWCVFAVSILAIGKYLYYRLQFETFTQLVPFGNISVFANYLALLVPIFFWLSLQIKDRTTRLLLWIGIAFEITIIFSTGSRAAALGIIAALALGIFLTTWNKKAIRYSLIAALIAMVIGIAALQQFRNRPFIQGSFILSKFSNISLSDESIRKRFVLFDVALQGVKAHPFVGWGRENFEYVFETNYNPSFISNKTTEVWTDRVHNMFLHVLVTNGIIGLTAYLLLLALFVDAVWSLHKAIILSLFFVVYLIQVFFSFDTAGTLTPFFLTSIILAHALPESADTRISFKMPYKAHIAITSILIGIFFAATVFFTIDPARASFTAGRAMQALPEDVDNYRRLLNKTDIILPDKNIFKAGLLFAVAQEVDIHARVKQSENIFEIEEEVIERLIDLTERHPQYIRLQHMLGLQIKNRAFRHDHDINKAIAYYENLVKRFPERQYLLSHLVELYAGAKNVQQALELIDTRLIPLSPGLAEPFWLRGKILFNNDKLDEARDSFRTAFEKNIHISRFHPEHITIANLLFQKEETVPYAIVLYEIAAKENPGNPNILSNLAFLYAYTGNRDGAVNLAQKILNLLPDRRPQIEEFIRKVKAGEKLNLPAAL